MEIGDLYRFDTQVVDYVHCESNLVESLTFCKDDIFLYLGAGAGPYHMDRRFLFGDRVVIISYMYVANKAIKIS